LEAFAEKQSDPRLMEESTFEGDPLMMTSVENMNIEENFGM
jgi:hypothetical protein